MKIAVTYENGFVFQHFGHSEMFKIYCVEDGTIISTDLIGTNGSGHGALAELLASNSVDTLICGGIGGGAKDALAEKNITLYGGVSGDADEVVAALLSGRLNFNPDIRCDHHDNENPREHHCGEHGCGKHNCR